MEEYWNTRKRRTHLKSLDYLFPHGAEDGPNQMSMVAEVVVVLGTEITGTGYVTIGVLTAILGAVIIGVAVAVVDV